MIGGRHVHDDAALQHLSQASLDARGAALFAHHVLLNPGHSQRSPREFDGQQENEEPRGARLFRSLQDNHIGGKAPICPSIETESRSPQCSAARSPSKRTMSIPSTVMRLFVAGIPMKSPEWVAV